MVFNYMIKHYSYSEILEIFVANLDNAWPTDHRINVQFNDIVIKYDPNFAQNRFYVCSVQTQGRYEYAYDTLIANSMNDIFLLKKNGDCIFVPRTKDEWFNLSMTEPELPSYADYENFVKINEYYRSLPVLWG